MKNEITKGKNILSVMSELVNGIGLENVKTSFNSKTGTASITGIRDGIQYTTTLKTQKNGIIQTSSQFDVENISKKALKMQIKDLKKQGYKQREIAEMLGISQPTVSNYLRK